ncbi:hypothetical protein BMT54_10400 [Pasteurellaceae bacterium 15-036681]|nr:hypothetical protein BMT54_10400 [Pasteurellaceae bacterium 15-036681]
MFRKLLIGLFLLTSINAFAEDKQNYSGTYESKSGLIIHLEKLENTDEYKYTLEFLPGKKTVSIAHLEEQKYLYDSKKNFIGEFVENGFKNSRDAIFIKK